MLTKYEHITKTTVKNKDMNNLYIGGEIVEFVEIEDEPIIEYEIEFDDEDVEFTIEFD